MSSAGDRHGAVEYGRRGATPNAVAVMRSLEVVELHEPMKAAIERRPAGEVVPAKDDAPVLGENRLLQALDEAVGPSVAWPDAGVADPEGPGCRGEPGLELSPTPREHSRDPPAPPSDGRAAHRT